jgi:hypothetical protein
MAVEIIVERCGKPPVTVRGTNIVPVEIGDRLSARSINGVRAMFQTPYVCDDTSIVIDLQSIREVLRGKP